jgi:hypothetical protein
MSIVKTATAGALGFDLNQPLSTAHAAEFKAAGYDFVVRYIPRKATSIEGNLTVSEISAILAGGLCLMAVQHVAMPGWEPSIELGQEYGQAAASYCTNIGLPKGLNIWLDLEEVAPNEDVIGYCKAWFIAVNAAGYVPGIYIGYNPGITGEQAYADLPFRHYWRAYNADVVVATRGYQILQHPQKALNGIEFDPNTIQADLLGDLPIWLSPS